MFWYLILFARGLCVFHGVGFSREFPSFARKQLSSFWSTKMPFLRPQRLLRSIDSRGWQAGMPARFTFPETNRKRTRKWMVGRWSFPFGARPIFRCYEKNSGRVDVNFFNTRGDGTNTHWCVTIYSLFFRLPAASLSVFSHWQVAIKCKTELFCEVKSNTLTRPRCKVFTYDILWLNAL